MAEKHRVFPVVYKNLSRMAGMTGTALLVDAGTLEQLKEWYFVNTLLTMRLTGELLKLLALFEAAGIRAIPFKGPVLSYELYGDVTSRAAGDLDLFIDAADMKRAQEILFDCGYMIFGSQYRMSPRQWTYMLERKREMPFVQGDTWIDVHWRFSLVLSESPSREMAERAVMRSLQDQPVRVLSREDNLLFLAVHGSYHGWTRLRWLADIAETIRIGGLDWELVWQRADKWGVSQMLGLALILAEGVFGIAGVPFSRGLPQEAVSERLALQALPMLAGTEADAEKNKLAELIYMKRYVVGLSPGTADKFEFIKELFSPTLLEFKDVHFSDDRFYLYYLIRPFLKLKRMSLARKGNS